MEKNTTPLTNMMISFDSANSKKRSVGLFSCLQGGPLLVINGVIVITPIDGQKSTGFTVVIILLIGGFSVISYNPIYNDRRFPPL